ncbi:hypothetical protein R80B4_00124 [Fibrobacteres bacterium R8-0-B4]
MTRGKLLAAIFIGGFALGVLLLYIDATEAAAYTFILTIVAGLIVLPTVCFIVDFVKSAPEDDKDAPSELIAKEFAEKPFTVEEMALVNEHRKAQEESESRKRVVGYAYISSGS